MDRLPFVALVVGGLLSYQMPVYLARYLSREGELNDLFARNIADAVPGNLLFFAAYLLAGFFIWAIPLLFAVSLVHPRLGRPVRRLLFFPVSPLTQWVSSKWDDFSDELEERQEMKRLYATDFAGQFETFGKFQRYYRWVVSRDKFDPREPLTTSSDGFQDAINLLGLPQQFDQPALNTRFGQLMKQVHPDIAGPNDIARRINEARDIIKARRSWR